MTFLCYAFGSVPLEYFLQIFEDLLVSRMSIGFQMGLFGDPFGAKLVHIL